MLRRRPDDEMVARRGTVRRNELTHHWAAQPDSDECRPFSAFGTRASGAASSHYGVDFKQRWVATLGSHAVLFDSAETARSCFASDKGDEQVEALVRRMVDDWSDQGFSDITNPGIERGEPALGEAAASIRIDFEMVGRQGARHRLQHHELDVLVGRAVLNLHLDTRPQVPLDLELLVRRPLSRVGRALR